MTDDSDYWSERTSEAEAEVRKLGEQLAEAAKIITQIGTTGAESTDTIRSAQNWLKRNGFENYL